MYSGGGRDQENSELGSLQFHSQLVHLYNQQSSLSTSMAIRDNDHATTIDPRASPAPSDACRSDGFTPICETEFAAVPLLVKRRAQLSDVNKVYSFLWTRAIKHGGPHNISKMEFAKQNLSVVGQTGEAKLATLRQLKLLEMNRDGSVRLLKDMRLLVAARKQHHSS
eukprot:GHVS01058277.1.p1 GENE.GHVS01058277.1~~GHVS01058277.1.p1  ORF type:complete len:167 (-),score=26.00 GHVS01058277.1:219-719(-)